jgi:hypothetical protein
MSAPRKCCSPMEPKTPRRAGRRTASSCYLGTIGRETGQDLWVLPLAGDSKAAAVCRLRGRGSRRAIFAGREMGRVIALRKRARPRIFIAPFPGPGKKIRVSGEGGANPKWRRDGRELFYLSADGIMGRRCRPPRNGTVFGTPHALFTPQWRESGYSRVRRHAQTDSSF